MGGVIVGEPVNVERRVLERRTSTQNRRVFLLWSDLSVLDVYEFAADAYTKAQEFIAGTGGMQSWTNTRPGRWWGPRGRLLQIEMRELKVIAGDRRAST